MAEQADISAPELRDRLDGGEHFAIYDVRKATDREWVIPGAIPLDVHDQLWANDATALDGFQPPTDRPVVFVCGRGNTSLLAATLARQHGIPAASLYGGMKAWSLQWNVADVPAPGVHADVIQVRRTGKGCLSYVVGSKGVAAVIDASVDPGVYLKLSQSRGWTIKYVIDTHIHADHLSRGRVLAEQAGAGLYLPDQKRARYPFRALADGETLTIGAAGLEVSATPGHTFESVSLLLDCKVLFTGDTLFLATVGRPDLAARVDEETKQRTHLLFASLKRIEKLPKETLVLPGHTSRPVPFDHQALVATLGDVRRDATLLDLSETAFVDAVLRSLPQPPANHLKVVGFNEEGVMPPNAGDLEIGGNRCAVEQGGQADKRMSG